MVACCPVHEGGKDGQWVCLYSEADLVCWEAKRSRFIRLWGAGWCCWCFFLLIDWCRCCLVNCSAAELLSNKSSERDFLMISEGCRTTCSVKTVVSNAVKPATLWILKKKQNKTKNICFLHMEIHCMVSDGICVCRSHWASVMLIFCPVYLVKNH